MSKKSIVRKSKGIDRELKKICDSLGMPRNSVERLALIEYLQSHFGYKLNSVDEVKN